MYSGFWQDLPRPIIGLSPMDGVTDAPFRYIAAAHGKPAITFTEFTSVEGIRAGALRLLDDFKYHDIERPVIAQLFGADPEAFYTAAIVVSALGFDGIDINMGCPAKHVVHSGAGAGLINDPDRALQIIDKTRQGAEAWYSNQNLNAFDIHVDIKEAIKNGLISTNLRSPLPVSVKTRIGYDIPVTEWWITTLLQQSPAAVTIHGRTLKQLYSGLADWQEIEKGARIIKEHGSIALGNGDVHSIEEAHHRIVECNLDGVLIGRAAGGNPWIFNGKEVTQQAKVAVALEHAHVFSETFPPQAFVRMRKHLLDYTKGMPDSKELRLKLARCSTYSEVAELLRSYL